MRRDRMQPRRHDRRGVPAVGPLPTLPGLQDQRSGCCWFETCEQYVQLDSQSGALNWLDDQGAPSVVVAKRRRDSAQCLIPATLLRTTVRNNVQEGLREGGRVSLSSLVEVRLSDGETCSGRTYRFCGHRGCGLGLSFLRCSCAAVPRPNRPLTQRNGIDHSRSHRRSASSGTPPHKKHTHGERPLIVMATTDQWLTPTRRATTGSFGLIHQSPYAPYRIFGRQGRETPGRSVGAEGLEPPTSSL